MPDVCVSRCRTVMSRHASGASEKYLPTRSSSESRPSSASIKTAAAVNCLPIDPDWKTVSGLTGVWCSTLAKP